MEAVGLADNEDYFCSMALTKVSICRQNSRRWGRLHPFLIKQEQLFFFFFFYLFRAAPGAHGSSQARGRIGAVAASPHHGQGNSGSGPRLQPAPQLTAMPDP